MVIAFVLLVAASILIVAAILLVTSTILLLAILLVQKVPAATCNKMARPLEYLKCVHVYGNGRSDDDISW